MSGSIKNDLIAKVKPASNAFEAMLYLQDDFTDAQYNKIEARLTNQINRINQMLLALDGVYNARLNPSCGVQEAVEDIKRDLFAARNHLLESNKYLSGEKEGRSWWVGYEADQAQGKLNNAIDGLAVFRRLANKNNDRGNRNEAIYNVMQNVETVMYKNSTSFEMTTKEIIRATEWKKCIYCE